ncbi:MAG TPA: amino acid adenylation domain-containing protein, partial [Thermoanaerobaculia bacterium]|nr:amino acid adenylation domain-containing protein [Thermoanaerobaculia bacterium]
MAAAIKEGFRLAPAQRGLLQADGTALDRRARAVAILHGPVAVDRWCAAIRQLVGEQEILRTRVGYLDELPAPVQMIDDGVAVEAVEIPVGPDAGWEALERDPGHGPVLRTSLSPVAAGGGWRWRISLPLVNSDRRGLVNLAAAVGRRYAGLADELPQYVDVGQWQQELLAGEETAIGRRFWQERGQALGEPLELRAPAGGDGGRARQRLDRDLWRRLCALAGDCGVSPEVVALAGWQVLAARQTDDPAASRWLAVRSDGRRHEPLWACLGVFARLLPIGVSLPAERSFREHLAVLAAELGEASRWEDCFVHGDPDVWPRPRLPALGFAYDAAIDRLRCGEVEVEVVEADAAAAEVGGAAVRLWCVERGDELEATVASTRAGRWGDLLEQWEELLRGAAAAPEREVGALPLLPARQRSVLLGWGRGERTAANGSGGGKDAGSVLSQIAAQARQRAGAPAVAVASAGAAAWSYQELWRRAARVARALRRLGVGRESVVGLHLGRSREQVAVLLGVWRAGGAYLPLALADPPARLAAMVEAAGACGVVSAGALADRLRVALGEGQDGVAATAVWEAGALLGEGEDCVRQAGEGEAGEGRAGKGEKHEDGGGEAREAAPGEPAPAGDDEPWPEQAAYVIYTSGSTGRPKGVVVAHGALGNYVRWARKAYGDSAPIDGLVHTPLSFDLTLTSLLVPLATGGRVELVGEAGPRESPDHPESTENPENQERPENPENAAGSAAVAGVEGLRRALERALAAGDGGTAGLLKLTPSHLRALSAGWDESGQTERRLRCRSMVVGGEPLASDLAARWRADGGPGGSGGRRLWNEYGPTEAVVGCCVHEAGEADAGAGNVAIGRPLANVELYVVDAWGELVPEGVAGELWVGGAGLARGYLGDPAATAERFVPDAWGTAMSATDGAPAGAPSGATPAGPGGGRLYRTGDRVRWRAGGVLEHLGRVDEQVKIRGHRIEPAEVEAALRALPGVREAVVVARAEERRPEAMRLVAYVVGDAGPEEQWRAALRRRLPEPMVPSALVRLEHLPLTAHGKLDRRSLPTPESGADAAPWEPPRTPIERILAEIWSELLGGVRVGRGDSFFKLGGDSILNIQAVARARRQGLSLTVEQLFGKPRLADLAADIANIANIAAPPPAPPAGVAAAFGLLDQADRERLPAGLDDAYPLSMLQQGMVYHGDDTAAAPLYHGLMSLHLGTAIDPAPLAACLGAMMRAHPVLRTAFDLARYGQPLQLVHAAAPVPLAVVDLRRLPAASCRRLVTAWIQDERRVRFAVERAPLFRMRLHQLAGGESQVSMSFHHAILDGWSVASFWTELFESYLGTRAGAPPPPGVAAETTQRDFVELEGRARRSAAQRSFWLGELDGARPTRLPRRGGPPPPATAAARRTLSLPFDAALGGRLRQVAMDLGVTLKSVLLAAHLKALSMVCGGRDLVTGLVANGRPDDAGGHLGLGLFLNTLPFRFVLDPDASWAGLIAQAHAKEGALLPFRRYPMAQLRLEMQAAELFETLFNFVSMHRYGDLLAAGVPVLGAESHQSANFVLGADFSLGITSPVLQLRLHYDAAAVTEAQASALAGHYAAILRQIAAAPAAPHRGYGARGGNEVRRREPAAGAPDPGNVVERIAGQARTTPAAVAVRAAGRDHTYGELAARTDRLAGHLHRLGVGNESVVAIRMPRGAEMIVAVLAVLQAGGAYLPIEADTPAERTAELLRDAGVAVAISQEPLADGLPSWVRVVLVDREAAAIAVTPVFTAAAAIAPEQAAYVIYTSGSTGKPKGVVVPHGGIANLAAQTWRIGVAPGRRVLQFASLAFDGAALEILGTLAAGGTLVVEERERLVPGPELVELLRRERIHGVTLPPTSLAQVPWAELPDLQRVIVAGEDCSEELAERWGAGGRLMNGYGPTETTVVVSCGVHQPGTGKPPIGRPIDGVDVYVVDEAGEEVPPGVPGELWVGGAGVARGYLGQPDKTAERFLPDGASGAGGARLYRTGDRGRRREDGVLEFLGRIDDQVKIRGYRIEPGEVEAALRGLPGIREAAVIAREDRPGEKRLVAYVVATGGSEAEWWAALRRRLPEFMVPAAIVLLEKLPLTTAAKLDRKALPAPERRAAGGDRQPPRTPVEQLLAEIWSEVLGGVEAGRGDDFFALGGHSLLVTQAVSRIRQAFAMELPLRELYDAPVLADLALRIERLRGADAGEAAIQATGGDGPWPLSHAQRRLWIADRLAASPATAAGAASAAGEMVHRPFNLCVPVRLRGEIALPALEWSLSEVVRRHEILRTRYADDGIEPVQVIDPATPVRLAAEDLGSAAELAALVREEARRGFDLRRGPVMRLRLARLGPQDQALILTLHHIAADAVSLGLLVGELGELYEARRHGRPPSLPALPIQYKDYARWQRDQLAAGRHERDLAYWCARLGGVESLRLGEPDGAADGESAGAEHRFDLGRELTARLRELGRRESVTMFMTLLAGLAVVLQRQSGQDDFVVGAPAAHRERRELEGLIGFFVNLLPLRLELGGNPSVRELLRRVRETSLEAYLHQEAPFDTLAERLRLKPDPGQASPLFRVVLAHQAAAAHDLAKLPSLEPIALPRETAMFDLSVGLAESATDVSVLLEYRTARFTAAAVRGLAGQLRAAWAALAAAPAQTLDAIELTGAGEVARLLAMGRGSGGRPAPPVLAAPSVVAAFEARVAAHPQAVAVRYAGNDYSYGELDRMANRIGGCLRSRGLGAESIVGLLMGSSPAQLAAMLGALKAGAAFLPLDPALPPVRQAQLAAAAGVALVLTVADTAGALPPDLPVLRLDRDLALGEDGPSLAQGVTVREDQLAYAMFTSGSSGRPKLVAVEHRALASYAACCQPFYQVGAAGRMAQLWNCTFDGMLSEVLPTLLSGGALVLGSAALGQRSARELLAWCESERITAISVPTAYWHEIAREVGATAAPPPASLRTLVIGGERVANDSLEVWRRHWAERVRLVNTYGPTETTVEVAAHVFSSAADLAGTAGAPLGRPLANARAYVVDGASQLAAVGAAGELWVGGPALSRGYLGDPAATAARFVPDRFGDEPGARLYRTGDLVRWNEAGQLEFLGRRDGQVKIRGYRVEPAEVEAALRSLPAV